MVLYMCTSLFDEQLYLCSAVHNRAVVFLPVALMFRRTGKKTMLLSVTSIFCPLRSSVLLTDVQYRHKCIQTLMQ